MEKVVQVVERTAVTVTVMSKHGWYPLIKFTFYENVEEDEAVQRVKTSSDYLEAKTRYLNERGISEEDDITIRFEVENDSGIYAVSIDVFMQHARKVAEAV